ncbi:hypothetical protein PENSPDRAFT_240584 [Peniophora sp. CONT]|nr:hypothetical protein PENSPDRAFT_240584 [Peniophora sp. CONT]
MEGTISPPCVIRNELRLELLSQTNSRHLRARGTFSFAHTIVWSYSSSATMSARVSFGCSWFGQHLTTYKTNQGVATTLTLLMSKAAMLRFAKADNPTSSGTYWPSEGSQWRAHTTVRSRSWSIGVLGLAFKLGSYMLRALR